MTERIYYRDPFQLEFDARVVEIASAREQFAVVLDRTAFYPTSGGQVFDTGRLLASGQRANVIEVSEREDGAVVHVLAPPEAATAPGAGGPDATPLLAALAVGSEVRGEIDGERRRDHMQQHTGQHVLSAAFVRLYDFATVSFHMGAETCTIDLDTPELTRAQVIAAEKLANEVVWEDRPVAIRFTSLDEAHTLGLRKLPERSGEIRLIDIDKFDLCACGGTHVKGTGQIGAILIRKTEKVRQGMRVEFVCGLRAVGVARRDFTTLTDAAALFSAHIHEVPAQITKVLEESRTGAKREQKLLEELAEAEAASLVASAEETGGARIVSRGFAERDAAFIKLLAQKIAAQGKAIAVLSAAKGQPTLVIAQSAGLPLNCGTLLRESLSELGGRGGGSTDMAQGGVSDAAKLEQAREALLERVLNVLAG